MVIDGGIKMVIKPNTKFIMDLLKEKNWSERKLAYKTGLSQATISRILRGKRGIGIKTFNALRQIFPEISPDTLFIIEGDATKRDSCQESKFLSNCYSCRRII
jgi:transcriptional regulator with XRE-family HTH domain